MGACDLAEPLQELVGRDDVAALALNRLHDDRRDLVGRDQVHEDLILEVAQALRLAALRLESDRAAIAVGIRRVINAGQHRPEAAALQRLAGRQRERSQGAAVKSAEERNDVGSARGVARELEARFHCFGA